MEKKKSERKPPLSFVNRGGKRATGTAVGDEDPDYSPMDDRRADATRGRRTQLAKEVPIRSSRV